LVVEVSLGELIVGPVLPIEEPVEEVVNVEVGVDEVVVVGAPTVF
jgi:hypothetical protein